jgi:hypothetical protein
MAKSLEEFRCRQRSTPDWILPGLLKRGNTLFIIGAPKKACKSWLMLAAAWDLSEGEPVWGLKRSDGEYLLKPSRPMRTVYLAQEDTEDDVHDRLSAHFSQGRAANDRLWIVPKNLKIRLDSERGCALLEEELDAVANGCGKIDLVMFDPFRRMHHGDENDSLAIAKIWGVLESVHRRYGCATIISHHTVKPPADRSLFDPTDPFIARGSGDIYGGGDAFINVVPKRLENDPPSRKVALYFESKRGRPLAPAMVKVHFDTGAVEWLGAAWERKEREEEGHIGAG